MLIKRFYGTLGICLLLVGCSNDEVVQYKIPKEESKAVVPNMPTPPAAASAMQQQSVPGLAESTEQFKQPVWQVPSAWEEQPKSAMRKGSFLLKEEGLQAEITVLAFPGDVGGDLANINRWAGQINAQPLDAKALDLLEVIDVDGLKGVFVELIAIDDSSETSSPQAVLGVILEQGSGTWFFKMMGDSSLVLNSREAFLDFVRSVKFQ